MKSVSVIIPTYNEAGNIIPLIESLLKNVDNLLEILVIDDNSPDNTGALATAWAQTHTTTVKVVIRATDHGLQKSISEGIRIAKGNIIVWMDGDFSHPPECINTLVGEIIQGKDIAVASRFVPGGKKKSAGQSESRFAIGMSDIGNICMRKLFRVPFHDFTSGFIAVKRTVIRSLPLSGQHGEYFINLIIRAFHTGYKIIELPYVSTGRVHGSSKTAPNLYSLLLRCFQYSRMIILTSFNTLKHN